MNDVCIFYCKKCDQEHEKYIKKLKYFGINSETCRTDVPFDQFLKNVRSSLCTVCLVCPHTKDICVQYATQIDETQSDLLPGIFFGKLDRTLTLQNLNNVYDIRQNAGIGDLAEGVKHCIDSRTRISNPHSPFTRSRTVGHRIQSTVRRRPGAAPRAAERPRTFAVPEEHHRSFPSSRGNDETAVKLAGSRTRFNPIFTDSDSNLYTDFDTCSRTGIDASPGSHPDPSALGGTTTLPPTIHPSVQFVDAGSLQTSPSDRGALVLDQCVFPSQEGDQVSMEDIVHQFHTVPGSKEDIAKFILSVYLPRLVEANSIDQICKLLLARDYRITLAVIETLQRRLLTLDYDYSMADNLMDATDTVWEVLLATLGDERSSVNLVFILLVLLTRIYLLFLSQPSQMKDNLTRYSKRLKLQLQETNKQIENLVCQPSVSALVRGLEFFGRGLTGKLGRTSILQMGDWGHVLSKEKNREALMKNVKKMDAVDTMTCCLLLTCMSAKPWAAKLLEGVAKQGLVQINKLGRKEKNICLVQCFRYLLVKTVVVLIYEKNEKQNSQRLTTDIKETLIKIVTNVFKDKSSVAEGNELLLEEIQSLVFENNETIRMQAIHHLASGRFLAGRTLLVSSEHMEFLLRSARCVVQEDRSLESRSSMSQWRVLSGTFGDVGVNFRILVPSINCLAKGASDSVIPSETSETQDHMNNLHILKRLHIRGTHRNVIKLLVYQEFPMPLFYGIQNCDAENFLVHLLKRRKNKEWCDQIQLVLLLKDALSAVRYMHSQNIIHRDLTAYRFVVSRDMSCLKLENFRIARQCQDINKGLTLPGDSEKLAVRWTAVESLIDDAFSTASDMYMFSMLCWEVLTHGCWPFTDCINLQTDEIMETVLNRGLNPSQPRCIPDRLFKLILKGLERKPENRITTDRAEAELNEIVSKDFDDMSTKPINRHNLDGRYPNSSWMKRQIEEKNGLPELGVPDLVRQLRGRHAVPYYNTKPRQMSVLPLQPADLWAEDEPICQLGAVLTVQEILSPFAIDVMLPRQRELRDITGLDHETLCRVVDNNQECLEYQYPSADTLLNTALKESSEGATKKYLKILLKLAKTIEMFHRNGWILRCITARDIWITHQTLEVCICRLARSCPLPDGDEEYVFAEVFSDRMHWLPVEVLKYQQYSKQSDVYMFAMTAYEVFTAMELHRNNPLKDPMHCVPFVLTPKEQLLKSLMKGEIPEKPAYCPERLYELMEACWSRDVVRRPTILEIKDQLEAAIDEDISSLPSDTELDSLVSAEEEPTDQNKPLPPVRFTATRLTERGQLRDPLNFYSDSPVEKRPQYPILRDRPERNLAYDYAAFGDSHAKKRVHFIGVEQNGYNEPSRTVEEDPVYQDPETSFATHVNVEGVERARMTTPGSRTPDESTLRVENTRRTLQTNGSSSDSTSHRTSAREEAPVTRPRPYSSTGMPGVNRQSLQYSFVRERKPDTAKTRFVNDSSGSSNGSDNYIHPMTADERPRPYNSSTGMPRMNRQPSQYSFVRERKPDSAKPRFVNDSSGSSNGSDNYIHPMTADDDDGTYDDATVSLSNDPRIEAGHPKTTPSTNRGDMCQTQSVLLGKAKFGRESMINERPANVHQNTNQTTRSRSLGFGNESPDSSASSVNITIPTEYSATQDDDSHLYDSASTLSENVDQTKDAPQVRSWNEDTSSESTWSEQYESNYNLVPAPIEDEDLYEEIF